MRFGIRNIIALDIQDRYVKCVWISYQNLHSWNVQKIIQRELPPSEDIEDPTYQNHTAHVIKSLLQANYPPENLVVSINGRDTAVRLLTLPPVGDRKAKDIQKMVRFELMTHLPVTINQMCYDYQVIGRSDDSTRVMTVAAKRSVMNRYLRLLSLAGVYPSVITTTSLTLFNAFVGKAPESIRNGTVGLVYLGKSNGDVVVCEDGCLIHARSFSFQPDANKEQLIREMRNSLHDTRYSTLDTENRDMELFHNSRSVSTIHLMTDDGQLPAGLTEDDLSRMAPGSSWKIYPAGDDLAFGMALAVVRPESRILTPSPLAANLLKQITQENIAAERKVFKGKLMRVVPAITIFVLLVVSGALWWEIHRAEGKLSSLENARQANKQQNDRISQLKDEEAGLQRRIKALDWAAEDYHTVSYRLYQISRAIPNNIWLKEVYIPEEQTVREKRAQASPKPGWRKPISKLYVVGYANEQRYIEAFLASLRECDCFSDIKQESTSEVHLFAQVFPKLDEKLLEFTLCLTSHPRADDISTAQSANIEGR